MKKQVFGRQFKRDVNERKALFKNLLTSLVLEERIKTTTAKAKAIKAAADKLVTKAKKGGQHAFRMVEADLNHDAVVKLLNDIAPRFTDRQGGYTRIIKIGHRVADNAPMSMMEWVEKKQPVIVKETTKAVTKEKPKAETKPKKAVKEPKAATKTEAKEVKKEKEKK